MRAPRRVMASLDTRAAVVRGGMCSVVPGMGKGILHSSLDATYRLLRAVDAYIVFAIELRGLK